MTVIPELRDALVRAAEEATGNAPVARAEAHGGRKRRRWGRGVGGGLAVVIVAAGLATGTGLVVPKRTLDRSAALATAPESSTSRPADFAHFGQELVAMGEQVRASLPYPPGMRDTFDWSQYGKHGEGNQSGPRRGTEARIEVQFLTEYRAGCMWRRYLVQEHDAGNVEGVRSAIQVLRDAADWPASRRGPTDPYWSTPFAKAAEAGNYVPIRNDLANNCAYVTLGASPAEEAAMERRYEPFEKFNAELRRKAEAILKKHGTHVSDPRDFGG